MTLTKAQAAMLDAPEPVGYTHWHEWAEAQYKVGRRQKRCPNCSLYYWPHLKWCNRCDTAQAGTDDA